MMFGVDPAEVYTRFFRENKTAIAQRAEELFEGLAGALLQVRSQLKAGQKAEFSVQILSNSEKPFPPCFEDHPLEHSARYLASDFLLAWCAKNDIQAVKRTLPPGDECHPSLLTEIAVDVVFVGA